LIGVVTTSGLAGPDVLVVDHSTQNVEGDLLMWSLSSSWLGVSGLDFTTGASAAAALTVAGLSDW
jgi:hypothetical protein